MIVIKSKKGVGWGDITVIAIMLFVLLIFLAVYGDTIFNARKGLNECKGVCRQQCDTFEIQSKSECFRDGEIQNGLVCCTGGEGEDELPIKSTEDESTTSNPDTNPNQETEGQTHEQRCRDNGFTLVRETGDPFLYQCFENNKAQGCSTRDGTVGRIFDACELNVQDCCNQEGNEDEESTEDTEEQESVEPVISVAVRGNIMPNGARELFYLEEEEDNIFIVNQSTNVIIQSIGTNVRYCTYTIIQDHQNYGRMNYQGTFNNDAVIQGNCDLEITLEPLQQDYVAQNDGQFKLRVFLNDASQDILLDKSFPLKIMTTDEFGSY
ncbi:MAG: hypothetical protein ACLFN8_03160 [Candidatus Woesearchaeota archaeon]